MALLPVGPTFDKTYRAGADLSSSQHCFVELTAASTVAVAVAADVPHGVLNNKPASGGQASVCVFGECLLNVNATTAIAVGDPLKPSTGGVGVAATTGDWAGARALEARASGTGLITVEVCRPFKA